MTPPSLQLAFSSIDACLSGTQADCQQSHPVSSLGFLKGLLVKAAALVIVNLQPLEKYFLLKKKKVEELF